YLLLVLLRPRALVEPGFDVISKLEAATHVTTITMTADIQSKEQQSLLSKLYDTRDEGQLGVVQLKCKNGCVLAHKSVLTAGSDYFRGMFNHKTIENETNKASFPDTSMESMNIIIQFIYARDIPILPEMTDKLIHETLIAADKMQFKLLFHRYWKLYSTPITLDNFADVWQLAQMFNQDEIAQNIRIFVLENMNEISETDSLADDISTKLLEDIISRSLDELTPDKLGDFITFLLSWAINEKKIQDVLKMISNCDIIAKLPDHILQELISYNEIVKKSSAIDNILCKEAASRWITSKQKIKIHALRIISERKLQHSISCLADDNNKWTTRRKSISLRRYWFPAVSRTGSLYYFEFCQVGPNNKQKFIAHLAGTKTAYHSRRFVGLSLDNISSETANHKEIYFRSGNSSYCCFNTEMKKWRTIDFEDRIEDCRCMLLATRNGRYFFDVDERRIKIIDGENFVYREKFAGRWRSVKCKTMCRNSSEKLFFYQKSKSESAHRLLIYDIEADCWNIVPAPQDLDCLVMLILYDDDFLLIFGTDNS
uniref:BTB domain-containing protein n=1 Tax=Strigamia maritima TaxID=126957 RepID=T1IWK5_STRMM